MQKKPDFFRKVRLLADTKTKKKPDFFRKVRLLADTKTKKKPGFAEKARLLVGESDLPSRTPQIALSGGSAKCQAGVPWRPRRQRLIQRPIGIWQFCHKAL
jgi:hypothetical protein